MSGLDVTNVQQEIHGQFAELKDALRERVAQETKGHVDVLLKEKIESINNAMTAADEKLEKAEKILALAKARREVAINGRPDVDPELKNAWVSFLRKNEVDMEPRHRELMRIHGKSLNSASDPSGGYLVIPYFDTEVTQRLYETSPIRQVSTIKTISTDQYEKPQQLDLAAAYWQDRDHDVTETNTQTWGRLTIPVWKLISDPRVSQDLLDDAYVDVETELMDSIAQSMDLLENAAFVNGTGKGQPRGILTYPAGTGWGQIEQVVSGDASKVTVDGLTNLVYSLKNGYLANATFIMNRSTIAAIRGLTNTLGNALWTPQFGSEPATIMGYPVMRAADFPAVASNSTPIAFGDFRRGYIVVDRFGTRILRNPYSNVPYVTFVVTRRVGAGVDNFEAFKLLKIST